MTETSAPTDDGSRLRSPLLDHPSVQRVRRALDAAGVAGQVVVLDSAARTAAQAATALGTTVGAIANSLVFVATTAEGSRTPLLVLTSGGHRVDTHHLAAEQGYAAIAKADAEFVREATGFAIGGVAPVAHARPVPTLVDVALGAHDVVWAAAGHPHTVFPTSLDELVRITGGRPVTVRPAD
jgi:prolyl-tRNA editing enzyme YbaK/EbsC (Cys-tRNA(Pro) deacylase)